MEAWWSGLGTPLQLFYGIAIVTSVLMVLQLLLSVLGFDGDADVDLDADFDGDAPHGSGVGILSVRTVTAFFTGFGWAGAASLQAGLPLLTAVLIALGVGGVLMMSIFLLMRAVYGMRHSGTLDYRNAVGVVGNVYLPIPPSMEGPGQIEVLVQGRLKVVRAFTRAAFKVPNRARVKVVEQLDQQTLLVEPLDPAPSDDDSAT